MRTRNDKKNYKSIIQNNTDKTQKTVSTEHIPFFEFKDGKLQGVVSSSSCDKRLYACVFNFADKTYTCHTNNNRACGELFGRYTGGPVYDQYRHNSQGLCPHLNILKETAKELDDSLLKEELEQLGSHTKEKTKRYSEVFTNFQKKVDLCERKIEESTFPEMRWFVGGK